MKDFFQKKNLPPLIKFVITLILFIYVKDFNIIDSFSKLAVALLEFIIILELVRMLIEFLLSDENRIRMRLMIDSLIFHTSFTFNRKPRVPCWPTWKHS